MMGREQKESGNLMPEDPEMGNRFMFKDQKWAGPVGTATAALQVLSVAQWPTPSPAEPSETHKNRLINNQATVTSAVQLMCYTRT